MTQSQTPHTGVLRSPEIHLLAEALAKAQGEMAVPEKKRTATVKMKEEKGGGYYTYKYADLSDVRAAVIPALSKNGLAVSQMINADSCRLTTLLIHSSGQFIGSTYDLPQGLPVQQFGSALTYGKRYSFESLVGVVGQEDDDAQVAQPYTQRQAKNAKSSPIIKPKTQQVISGTAGPALVNPPSGMTRIDIMAKIADAYLPLMTLEPNFDIASHIYANYGAQTKKDLRDEEAYDLMQFMETRVRQGVAS